LKIIQEEEYDDSDYNLSINIQQDDREERKGFSDPSKSSGDPVFFKNVSKKESSQSLPDENKRKSSDQIVDDKFSSEYEKSAISINEIEINEDF
jgi:hypothetical protein